MTNTFMGRTEACLRDFAGKYPAELTRPLLAEFCGVEPGTAGEWLRIKQLPVGEPLIRLRVFLGLLGYRVAEMDDLKRPIRRLAQLIAVDVMPIVEVQELLNYKRLQRVYEVVLRGQGLMGDRVRTLQNIVEQYEADIDTGTNMWRARIEDVLEGQQAPSAPSPRVSSGAYQAAASGSGSDVEPDVVRYLVAALSALLDNGIRASDDTPAPLPDERRKPIIDRVGRDRVGELIAKLELLQP